MREIGVEHENARPYPNIVDMVQGDHHIVVSAIAVLQQRLVNHFGQAVAGYGEYL